MNFLRPAKYFFLLSSILTFISIGLLFFPGPRLSIEFTGGTRIELKTNEGTLKAEDILKAVQSSGLKDITATVNRSANGNFIIRTKNLTDEEHKNLLSHINKTMPDAEELQYSTIGPTVGETLKIRAMYALTAASIGIVGYLAFAFRKIPRKYSAWKFGVVAVATLLHDVMVTVGIFVILSHTTNFELDTLFVTALLTILGYSVNDTIIIFDRIRDNLLTQERKENFATTANNAVNQAWKRSCYTSTSTLIMLFSLFFFGSESIRWFVLTLIVGILLGTYSSIFVATPLLVFWEEKTRKSS